MKLEAAKKILEETKAGYNQIAEHFSVTRIWPWKVMESFFSYLKPDHKILDIGCGNGRLYEAIKDKKIEYAGIDNSEQLIEKAREKHQSVVFQIADALSLPFEDGKFDHVFMMAVLPHIPSPELQLGALKNAYRILKPGGYLFITCWNLWQPKILWKNFKNRIKNPRLYRGLGWQDFLITWRNSQRNILSQRFYHAFTKKELNKILEKAGFKVEQIYYEYKGEKSNWLKGFNLVAIAKK
jgi:ubiquinone/menaquinone biosynthesis C-methylase UbiE